MVREKGITLRILQPEQNNKPWVSTCQTVEVILAKADDFSHLIVVVVVSSSADLDPPGRMQNPRSAIAIRYEGSRPYGTLGRSWTWVLSRRSHYTFPTQQLHRLIQVGV